MMIDHTVKLKEQNSGFKYSETQLSYYVFQYYILEIVNREFPHILENTYGCTVS